MAQGSSIEWTEATWNPVTGCTKVSPGCKHCYAERMAIRRAMENPRYPNGFDVTLHEDLTTLPLRWKKPRRIFVNSMSDLFHEEVPQRFLAACFKRIFGVSTSPSRNAPYSRIDRRRAGPIQLRHGLTSS